MGVCQTVERAGSPQRNINKINGVRNTKHAPATMLQKNNM